MENVAGVDGSLIHKCVCCPTYFATLAEVQKHQLAIHGDKLSCRKCNKVFKEPDNLSAHIRYAHGRLTNVSKEPPKKYLYVCPRCGELNFLFLVFRISSIYLYAKHTELYEDLFHFEKKIAQLLLSTKYLFFFKSVPNILMFN